MKVIKLTKKIKRKQPNWDLIQNKMLAIVECILQKKYGTLVTLDVYEFSGKLPITDEKNFDGFVGYFNIKEKSYIDYIAIRKHKSKKYKTFVLAHELGHVLDYLQNNYNRDYRYTGLNEKEKLELFETEKRAFSNGYDLLKTVGVSVYYLENFVIDRSNCLGRLVYSIENIKSKKKSKKLCIFY